MAKATHSGTCQICGNLQKLPSSLLSQHGYTVQWGFFSGTCQGSHGKPFEESTDLIEAVVAKCQEDVLIIKELIKTIREATGSKAYVHHYHRSKSWGCTGGYKWERVNLVAASIRANSSYISHKMYLLEGDEKHHEACTNGYPETCEEAAKECNENYIGQKLEKDIKQLESYIAWQSERVENWKPGTLIPVKEE